MNNNRKGFTLVEIIVSISIGLVVLAIVGSMILSSFDFMFSTTDMDIDKRAIDSIIKLVREDVEYAYDVRLMKSTDPKAPEVGGEDGWHCYYVKDGVLYRDGEKVLSDEYYNHKTFSMESKGNYQNGIRVDFKYSLNNGKEDTYSARDTIMFLNVQVSDSIKQGGLYTEESTVSLTENGYRLYYNGKSGRVTGTPEEPDKPDDTTGTVEDLLSSIDITNNRWFYGQTSYAYRYGDCVFYDGYWWMYAADTPINGAPGLSSSHWKRLTSEWTKNSKYELGDVVTYNGKYYERVKDDNWNAEVTDIHNPMWKEISKEEAEKKEFVIKHSNDLDKDVIIKKLNGIDESKIPLWEESKNLSYKVFNNTLPTQPTDFVKIRDEIVTGEFYHYYYRVFNNDAKPGTKSSDGYFGWQEVKLDYDANSAYIIGDVVIANAGNENVATHVQTNYNILTPESLLEIKNLVVSLQNLGQYDPNNLYKDYLSPTYYYVKEHDNFVWKIYKG